MSEMQQSIGAIEILAVISPMLIAIVTGLFAMETRHNRKAQKRSERNAELRAKESRLALRLMFSTVLLSDATALAVQHQKVNGEMSEARQEAVSAKAEYERFMQDIVSEQVVKI